MATTPITTGLEFIFGTLAIAAAIIAMMAIGAVSEAMSYARNPYLRQRRAKIMLNKMHYAFA
jgi:hypothetical protein